MAERAASSARVLSIQSTVVHGYVGNKSAVFPLQTLGIEVDPINSVQFSNHTGYPLFTGHALDGPQLTELVRGLMENGLIDHTHLLTGYMKSPSILRTVVETLRLLRAKNPNTTYFCDPVMGDNGELYVPEELVPVYRDEVVPQATVLTPNQFEAETLTGVTISSDGDAVRAMDCLHAKGVKIVVVTSCVYGSPDTITLVASRAAQESHRGKSRFKIVIPKIRASFTGTGDLLAALLLAWLDLTDDLKTSIENATATVQAVLSKTVEAGGRELRIIQCRNDIVNPSVPEWLRAEPLPEPLEG